MLGAGSNCWCQLHLVYCLSRSCGMFQLAGDSVADDAPARLALSDGRWWLCGVWALPGRSVIDEAQQEVNDVNVVGCFGDFVVKSYILVKLPDTVAFLTVAVRRHDKKYSGNMPTVY